MDETKPSVERLPPGLTVAVDLGGLFGPDALAEDSYNQTWSASKLQPELRLMLAVLVDALDVLKHPVGTGKKRLEQLQAQQEVLEWVFGDDHDGLFSFNSVCSHLDLDPDYLRKGLRKWL